MARLSSSVCHVGLKKHPSQRPLAHFTSRLCTSRMSFTTKPTYVPWRPNRAFIKFFEDMKKRRIPATDSPTMKVTDTPAPSATNLQKSNPRPLKVNYSSISETLVNTAKAQTNSNKCNKRRVKKGTTVKRSRAGKGNASLERKIKKHTF